MIRFLRLVYSGWTLRMKELSRSLFFISTALLEPLIFASVAYYLFKAGDRPNLTMYSGIGAGMMGIWATTVYGSADTISWHRWQRTLELLVASPPRFATVMFPLTLASSTVGLYALFATVLWSAALFDVPFSPEQPLVFVLAVVVVVMSLGVVGLFLATSFLLVYRNVMVLANLLEIPVWLVSGVLIPLSVMPAWLHPIGYALPPTWGFKAIREATFGGDPLPAIALCVLLTVPFVVAGLVSTRALERRARERATLALV